MVKVKTHLRNEMTVEANKSQVKRLMPFMLIACICFILIGILTYEPDNTYSIFCILCGILLVPFWLVLTKITQKSINKSMPLFNAETTVEFEFTENKFFIHEKRSEDYEGTTNAKYSCIYKVEETKNAYLLWISKAQLHVFYKDEIIEGTEEELNQIFKLNFGKNFKQPKKK